MIRALDAGTRAKVRAGFVVPSVLAAVQELVHNAVDAGALKVVVSVDLENLSVCVEDNGSGVAVGDLGRHFTSREGDPNAYGFRGEALACLADLCGALVVWSRGQTGRVAKSGFGVSGTMSSETEPLLLARFGLQVPLGPQTVVIAHRLFTDQPVRLKYARQRLSEALVKRDLQLLALRVLSGRKDLLLQAKFVYTGRQTTILKAQAHQQPELIYRDVFGTDPGTFENISVTLDHFRLTACFRRSPFSAVCIVVNEIPLQLNLRIMRDLHKAFGRPKRHSLVGKTAAAHLMLCLRVNGDVSGRELTREHWTEIWHALGSATGAKGSRVNSQKAAPRKRTSLQRDNSAELLSDNDSTSDLASSASPEDSTQHEPSSEPPAETPEIKLDPAELQTPAILGQVDRLLIVSKTSTALLFFDQHACDERHVVEQLLKEYVDESADPSRDLRLRCTKPVHVPFTKAEVAHVATFRDELAGFGIQYEEEPDGFVVTHLPWYLQNHATPQVLVSLLYGAQRLDLGRLWFQNVHKIPSFVAEAITFAACRQSIKFGQALLEPEMLWLIQLLGRCQTPFQCAHGRPTVIPVALPVIGAFNDDYEL